MKKIAAVAGVIAIVAGGGWLMRERILDRIMQHQIDRTLTRADESLLTDGKLHVVLCGTAAALPDAHRAGPCPAILANGEFRLIGPRPDSVPNFDPLNPAHA